MKQAALRKTVGQAAALAERGTMLREKRRWPEALAAYDAALAADFFAPNVWCNRGILLHAMGRREEAVKSYNAALRQRPHFPEAWSNLGNSLTDLGKLDKALTCYETALRQNPSFAEAWCNRGHTLKASRRFPEAFACYESALRLKSDLRPARYNRAVVLQALGQWDAAVAAFDEFLDADPSLPEAWFKRGTALYRLKRYEEALASFDRAIDRRRAYPEAWTNRGAALKWLGRGEESVASHDVALEYRPGFPEAFSNRGITLQELGRWDEALQSFDAAVAVDAAFAGAWSNRGLALQALNRLDDALASFDTALALDPDAAQIRFNQGVAKLLAGDFQAGWAGYEFRWSRPEPEQPIVAGPWPAWAGQNLDGRTLVVHSEQGLGDTIQFVRYLAPLKGPTRRIVFVTRHSMHAVLAEALAGIEIRAGFSADEAADFHCPLMSLPKVLKTTLETVPAPVPYLSAEPDRVAAWRGRLGSEGFRIGILWHGNKQGRSDRRAVPLAAFAPIARLPGVRLISLQKGHGLGELDGLPEGMAVETLDADFDAGPDAFLDTAAVLMSLDLVIGSDTSVIHLAGALGRPVFLALRQVPEWRWLMERDTSPWYPGLTLFRQRRDGDWTDVFARLAEAVTRLAG